MNNKIKILMPFIVLLGFCGRVMDAGEGGKESGVSRELFSLITCTDSMECQDGIWCNGIEYCGCFGSICGRCLPGYRQYCDDNNPCTVDNCINDIIGTPGSTGVPGEIGTGHCEHTEICVFCYLDEDCNDGDVCTTDSCVDNICRNVSMNCDDGDICTLDSCDPFTGCVNDPVPECCHDDSDCFDDNTCTIDTCNTSTHSCVYTADIGAMCEYPNECFDPGMCRPDGLCGPGTLNVPVNDTCDGVIDIMLSDIGEACVEGSTLCARDDYSSTCGGGGNPDLVYRFIYTVGNSYQLYSYNVVLDAEFNSVLYAQAGCGNPSTELTCNDNCTSDVMIDCDAHELGILDSAVNLPPAPVGMTKNIFLGVDGIGGARGDFELQIHRVSHRNNPCYRTADTGRRIDATFGGQFRGNINGYINDMHDAAHTWLKTPCHGPGGAGSDWPGNAWFTVSPALTTTYCIWTDETNPAAWADTVISVWDNTLPSGSGCGAVKRYVTCAHMDGRNGGINPTKVELTVPGGSTYMVGISSYERPTSGNYAVHFEIGACGETCEEQGGIVFGDHCYIHFLPARDWAMADAVCVGWGGHLVTIEDGLENEFIRSNFAAVSGDSPWIGFHDTNTEGTWEWVTGGPVTYLNWEAGQPDDAGGNQDWGQMLTNGRWADCGPACGTRSCVCEKP